MCAFACVCVCGFVCLSSCMVIVICVSVCVCVMSFMLCASIRCLIMLSVVVSRRRCLFVCFFLCVVCVCTDSSLTKMLVVGCAMLCGGCESMVGCCVVTALCIAWRVMFRVCVVHPNTCLHMQSPNAHALASSFSFNIKSTFYMTHNRMVELHDG